jgi:squalene cyclase
VDPDVGAEGETGAEYRAALEKGTAWLAGAEPANRQAKVLKLLVAVRAGKPRSATRAAADELLALQQPDAGWGQAPGAPSDAFAPGETLYTLALAGYTTGTPQIQHAVDYLVATQRPDGSWPMTSRASPDGKPR